MALYEPEGFAGARAAVLADALIEAVSSAEDGHCFRVDYLSEDECYGVAKELVARKDPRLSPFVLSSEATHELAVGVDRAIELRNRKVGVLCLMVPPGLVGSAVSSLGNAFAVVDGRSLLSDAAATVLGQLDSGHRTIVRKVESVLRGRAHISNEARLDFHLVAARMAQEGTFDLLGREFWRVGLIPDSRSDFTKEITANRSAVSAIARPSKPGSTMRDRISSIPTDDETQERLEKFFHGHQMHDVGSWAKELLDVPDLMFDAWVFPERVASEIRGVHVKPFVGPSGGVLNDSGLKQPDGLESSLLAFCVPGTKGANVTIKWETEPANQTDVVSWDVVLEPAGEWVGDDSDESVIGLPSKRVKGKLKKASLRMEIELDPLPDHAFWVRLTALDAAGNPLESPEDGPVTGTSDEFYLTNVEIPPPPGGTVKRTTVPSMAQGLLEEVIETNASQVDVGHYESVSAGDLKYVSARVNERKKLNVGLSPFLEELETWVLVHGRIPASHEVALDEIRPAQFADVTQIDPELAHDEWTEFVAARTTLFRRIRESKGGLVEALVWDQALADSVTRYSRAYAAALQSASDRRRHDLLIVDTLLVTLQLGGGEEQARVCLPTHPLRLMWLAAHGRLLETWWNRATSEPRNRRKQLLDIDLARQLQPLNVPAFLPGRTPSEAFLFFENLDFFNAIALPADATDPLRQIRDLRDVLGMSDSSSQADDRRAELLGTAFRRFRVTHPYANPINLALLNPDRGELLAAAVGPELRRKADDDDEDDLHSGLLLNISAYVGDETRTRLPALDVLRAPVESGSAVPTDHLQPGLATSVQPRAKLAGSPGVHLVVVADALEPRIVTMPEVEGDGGSVSLYGLLVRFLTTTEVADGTVEWVHRLAFGAKVDEHPAGARYSEALIDVQRAYSRALGSSLGSGGEAICVPAAVSTFSADQQREIEALHEKADWVVTSDRFFGVDYYDSPNMPMLDDVARKYVIDYAPEFVEGVGHRLMVTTSRRGEIEAMFHRAMDELGFQAVESSVGQLLQYLKTVSGGLALQAMSESTTGTAAVSLGAVTAWLQQQGRLANSVLVPVDVQRQLFSPRMKGAIAPGERRCDLALFSLRRRIVDATFIEVKWRRSPMGAGSMSDLIDDMEIQMSTTADVFEQRFFDPERIDGPMQRSHLANVLRFYANRAKRYGLMADDSINEFLVQLQQLERENLELRVNLEGFIVSLDDSPRKVTATRSKINLLTAADFATTVPGWIGSAETAPGDGPSADAEAPLSVQDQAPPEDDSGTEPDDQPGKMVKEPVVVERDVDSEGIATPLAEPAQAAEVVARESIEQSEPEEENGPANESPISTVEDASEAASVGSYSNQPEGRGEPLVDVSVVLGESRGDDVAWQPKVQGSPHLFVTGLPGQGKTQTVVRLLTELSKQGIPALTFDFHGTMASEESAYIRAASPTVVNAADGLPFSPFENEGARGPNGWQATAYAITDIFTYICGLGDMQKDVLFVSIRDAFRERGYGSDTTEPPTGLPSLEDVRVKIQQAEDQKRTRNLIARTRPLLEMDVFDPDKGQGQNLLDMVSKGLIVDFHDLPSETLQLAGGAFLLRKIHSDMFRWGETDHIRMALVLDEAHRLAKDVTLPKIMKEGRKFGVLVVAASQGHADFHSDVLLNAGTKIAYRANNPESKKIAGYFTRKVGVDIAETLEGLSVGHAYVQTPEMKSPAVTAMRLPED
jgi:DNA phosphorothioation-dependent restriction protein DptH